MGSQTKNLILHSSLSFRKMFWEFCSLILLATHSEAQGDECGCAAPVQPRIGKQRIVGGGEVNPKYSLPFQALFQIDGNFRCGGTIINKKNVLTAAHCVVFSDGSLAPADRSTVTVGEHDRCDGVNEGGQEIAVDSFVPRNDWNRFSISNDVAIIKLKEDITFTARVQPACL